VVCVCTQQDDSKTLAQSVDEGTGNITLHMFVMTPVWLSICEAAGQPKTTKGPIKIHVQYDVDGVVYSSPAQTYRHTGFLRRVSPDPHSTRPQRGNLADVTVRLSLSISGTPSLQRAAAAYPYAWYMTRSPSACSAGKAPMVMTVSLTTLPVPERTRAGWRYEGHTVPPQQLWANAPFAMPWDAFKVLYPGDQVPEDGIGVGVVMILDGERVRPAADGSTPAASLHPKSPSAWQSTLKFDGGGPTYSVKLNNDAWRALMVALGPRTSYGDGVYVRGFRKSPMLGLLYMYMSTTKKHNHLPKLYYPRGGEGDNFAERLLSEFLDEDFIFSTDYNVRADSSYKLLAPALPMPRPCHVRLFSHNGLFVF
jgi:hypothetical protein